MFEIAVIVASFATGVHCGYLICMRRILDNEIKRMEKMHIGSGSGE